MSETVTTPAAPAKKVAAKKPAAKKAPVKKPAAKPAAKTPAKKAAKAPVTREGVDSQNGITRPKPDSDSGKVWKIADSLSAKAKAPAKRADVLAEAEKAGVNAATAATQFNRWRQYNGLVKAKG